MDDVEVMAALRRLNASMAALTDSRTELARGLDRALDTMTRRIDELDQEFSAAATSRRLDAARDAAKARMLKRSQAA